MKALMVRKARVLSPSLAVLRARLDMFYKYLYPDLLLVHIPNDPFVS